MADLQERFPLDGTGVAQLMDAEKKKALQAELMNAVTLLTMSVERLRVVQSMLFSDPRYNRSTDVLTMLLGHVDLDARFLLELVHKLKV